MLNTTNFPKAKRIWYQGKFYDWSDSLLHSMTHALHYGTSVFEGIRAYPTDKGPAIFRLSDHIDRFLHSASVVKMKQPYGKAEIEAAVRATVGENGLQSCYIRPLMFYSYGNLGLVPKASPVELVIAAWEWGAYHGENAAGGVSAYIVPWRRVHHSQIDMRAKLGGIYVQSTICGLEARDKGCDEAVFLNLEGRVAEGPGENIFVVKDGVVKTNSRSESILEGITRTSVLEVAADLGFKTAIGPITKDELLCRRRGLLHRDGRGGRLRSPPDGRFGPEGVPRGRSHRHGTGRRNLEPNPRRVSRPGPRARAALREVADLRPSLRRGRELRALRRILAAAVLAAWTVLPAVRGSSPTALLPAVRVDRLENGLTLVSIPLPDPGVVALATIVRAGARNEAEPGTGALAHLMAHLADRGPLRSPRGFAPDLLARLGARAEGFVSDDATIRMVVFSGPENLGEVVRVEADRVINLEIEAGAVRREAAILEAEAGAPAASPDIRLEDELRRTAFLSHPYGRPARGIRDDFRTLPERGEAAQLFQKRAYAPDNVVLLAAGDFSPSAAARSRPPRLRRLGQVRLRVRGPRRADARGRPAIPRRLARARPGPAGHGLSHPRLFRPGARQGRA